jgi:hypothetical protein
MNHLMLFSNEIAFNSSDRATLVNTRCGQDAARGPRVMTVVSERVNEPRVQLHADHYVIKIW